ncbi:MAG: response regulator [Acidobacteria bacterium]|nr:response regulator [Acidobacteriota bacterium]
MPLTHNRILYVDNNEDSCEMMKVLLTMQRYEVTVARTATEGLRLAQRTPFDLYLFDTHLPEISGLTLCEQICVVPHHAPVAFISCAAYEADKQRGLQAGAIAYFTKPLDFAAFETWLPQQFAKAPKNQLAQTHNDRPAPPLPAHATMDQVQ